MKVAVIIAAAGIGRRMGGDRPKQYLEIGGKPLICHTLDRFREASCVGDLTLVVEPGREKEVFEDILQAYDYPPHWRAIAGGKVRQESVANGLKVVAKDCDVVLIHDGVRPFVTAAEIEAAAAVAFRDGACIVAAPVKDTIKRVGADGSIVETVDRERLWGAQTPQGFRIDIIRKAFDAATRDGFIGTDDASLVERMGVKVTIVEGTGRNFKITTPADMKLAEIFVQGRAMNTRIGTGYDIHKLIEGRPLILGGVNIPFEKGLLGHSDGDALLHAVADAMLGAAALGDIGKHFPDTDPKYKGADSGKLLQNVAVLVSKAGWQVSNIDANIIAERPKMAQYIDAMRARIAGLTGIDVDSVSVKARTNEGLDAVGRGEAIAAQAVVILGSR